jgi:hypothetical protein
MSARLFWKFWFPLYLLALGCLIAALLFARQQALSVYGTDVAREEWQEWVKEAREQEEGEGPIRRRAPKTDTPPALILMRDYFVTTLAGSVVLCSAVYWSFAFLLNGALTTRSMDIDRA